MTVSTQIYFDTRSLRKKTGDYPYKLKVYHAGVPKFYPTIFGLSIKDNKKLTAKNLGPQLQEIRDKLQEIDRTAAEFIKKMDPFCFDDFQRDFVKGNPFFDQTRIKAIPVPASQQETDFTPFHKKFPILLEKPAPETIGAIYQSIIKEKLAEGRSGPIKTAMNFQCAYFSLKRFGGNVGFKVITADYLKRYAHWMKEHIDEGKKKKCTKTTISMYTRTLRTVFNTANRLKVIKKENCYPFGEQEFSIPGSHNVKKVFTEGTMERIYYYDDSKKTPHRRKAIQKAKSFWFFMYFGQGMNPKDVCLLQFKNIHGEFLIFERAKTEDTMKDDTPQICAYITEDMWQTINQYGNQDRNPENYIFPIFTPEMTPLRQYEVLEYFIKFVNKWIQVILDDLGIDEKAGCQVARGSYATSRAEAGAGILEIGQDLGHKKVDTTRRYVGTLPLSRKKTNAGQQEAFKRKKDEQPV